MADTKGQMKSGDLDMQVINGDDVINHKPDRVDARFSRPLARLIPASKVSGYESKEWPVLGDADEKATNALGLPLDAWLIRQQKEKKAAAARALAEQQRREAELKARQAEEARQEQLTVEALERIRQEAYDEGHKEGFEQGNAEGFAQGLDKGQQEGQEKGYAEGQSRGYEEGFTAGREEGFQQGHSEGLSGGEQIVLTQAERFRHLADSLANPLREMNRDVTDEIVYLVSRLARVITARELKGDVQCLRQAVGRALEILPNAKKGAEISLNPDDAAMLEAAIGREYMTAQHWDIRPDESLSPGDVVVQNSASIVDWRVNDRIDALLEDFLEAAAPAVDAALREEIEDAPAYDAAPQKPLAPPPSLAQAVGAGAKAGAEAAADPAVQAAPEDAAAAAADSDAAPDAAQDPDAEAMAVLAAAARGQPGNPAGQP